MNCGTAAKLKGPSGRDIETQEEYSDIESKGEVEVSGRSSA
jgi:hypothetical protein